MNKIDYLEKELARLLVWIQAADTRITLVLPLSTAMLGVLAVLITDTKQWSNVYIITTSFSVLFLVASISFLALATFPRINGPKGSIIYFSGINNMENEQYKEAVNALDQDTYINDLANQCHINAQVANIKFTWIKRSLLSLYFSSIPWILSVYFLYGIK